MGVLASYLSIVPHMRSSDVPPKYSAPLTRGFSLPSLNFLRNRDIRRAAHGYESTREAAMAAFAKSWRRE
jgi:hypothetical protein